MKRLASAANKAVESRDYDEAQQAAARALRISNRSGSQSLVAWALSAVGSVYWNSGEYKEALKAYEDSLKIERRLGNAARIAKCTRDVGALLAQLEAFEEAEGMLLESLEQHRKLNLRTGTAKCLLYLAASVVHRHDHAATVVYATESSEIFQSEKHLREEAQSRFYLAASLLQAGRIDESAPEVERVLSLYRLNSLPGLQRALLLHGWQKSAEGDSVEATRLLNECIELAEYAEDHDGLQSAAHIYWLQGDTDASLNLLHSVLELLTEEKQRDRAIVLNTIGYEEMFAGIHNQAEANLTESLRIYEDCNEMKGVSYTLNNMGYLRSRQTRYQEARELYLRSLKIKLERNDEWGSTYSLIGLAECYLNSGNTNMAAKLLGNASATLDRLNAPIEKPGQSWFDDIVSSARESLGDEDYSREFSIGQQTPWRELSEYMLQVH